MWKKWFSVEQIVAVLKRAGLGLLVADLIQDVGISKQTFYRWKEQYAGFASDQVRELEQVVEENARLRWEQELTGVSIRSAPKHTPALSTCVDAPW